MLHCSLDTNQDYGNHMEQGRGQPISMISSLHIVFDTYVTCLHCGACVETAVTPAYLLLGAITRPRMVHGVAQLWPVNLHLPLVQPKRRQLWDSTAHPEVSRHGADSVGNLTQNYDAREGDVRLERGGCVFDLGPS